MLGITWIRDILQGNHAPLTTRGKRFKGQVLALMRPRLGKQQLGWHIVSRSLPGTPSSGPSSPVPALTSKAFPTLRWPETSRAASSPPCYHVCLADILFLREPYENQHDNEAGPSH